MSIDIQRLSALFLNIYKAYAAECTLRSSEEAAPWD